MDQVEGVGGWEGGGGGGGWEAEIGLSNPWAQGNSHCVFSKAQPQYTCQSRTVAGDSLTPWVALLVRPSGTMLTVSDL